MPYEIDIQKALSFPHCSFFYKMTDNRCALGAIYDSINITDFSVWDHRIQSALSSDMIRWLSSHGLDYRQLAFSIGLQNDQAKSDLERDLIRRHFIAELLEKGVVIPCAKDTELAKELLVTQVARELVKHQETVCPTT